MQQQQQQQQQYQQYQHHQEEAGHWRQSCRWRYSSRHCCLLLPRTNVPPAYNRPRPSLQWCCSQGATGARITTTFSRRRPVRVRSSCCSSSHLLAAQPRFHGESHSLLDAWVTFVMAHAVTRDLRPAPRG